MQQVSAGAALVPFQRPRIGDYRKPKQVDLAAMEEALRKGLQGKFFTVKGFDVNEYEDEEERIKEESRRLREINRQVAAEKLKIKIEAQRAAREALLQRRTKSAGFSVAMILEAVCLVHEVSAGELLGQSRRKAAVSARQHCCWLLRKVLHKSNTEIGKVVGRDHSTVIHAITVWELQQKHFEHQITSVEEVLGIRT